MITRAALLAAALGLAACQTGQDLSALPKLSVAFADSAWTGGAIPAGQQCRLNGGQGATPALRVSGLPAGTAEVVVAYNDRNYAPLSYDGGHGKIGYAVPAAGGTATLPSVPGMSRAMPAGVRIVAASRGRGDYASPGYLPPCSGGAGHVYEAVVTAVDASGTAVAAGEIVIGRY